MKRFFSKLLAVLICIVISVVAMSGICVADETAPSQQGEWYTFAMFCNEGNNNAFGDVGNTIMIFSLNPSEGVIKQATLLWDIFITDEVYESEQTLDQPFRDYGAEKALEVVNENFGQDIDYLISINYLNLALLVDFYGGVYIDLSRADRNAINGLLGDKIAHLESELNDIGIDAAQFRDLTASYYLDSYGPGTFLSGMQAVAYGWLQYDSIVNCCMREVEVVSQMFFQMNQYVRERANIYTTETQTLFASQADPDKRSINLDDMSSEDRAFLLEILKPILDRSYTNADEEFLLALFEAILRKDVNDRALGNEGISAIQYQLIPVFTSVSYEREVNGIRGRVINFPENIAALDRFLYNPEVTELIITK